MIIDGQTVITGSFNFTKNAEENNAENLLVIRPPELATKYASNWDAHLRHSEKYKGKERGYSETHHTDSVPMGNAVTTGYVASKNSQCSTGPTVRGRRRFGRKRRSYSSREEANQAGKKPCHECNP